MSFCPNCGSYVSSEDDICDCGAYVGKREYLGLKNPVIQLLLSYPSLMGSQRFLEFIYNESNDGFKFSHCKPTPQWNDSAMDFKEIIVGFVRNDSLELKEFKFNFENGTYELYNEESKLNMIFNENNKSFEKFIIFNRIEECEKKYGLKLYELGFEYPIVSFSDKNNKKIIFKYDFEAHEFEYDGEFLPEDYIEFSKDFKMVSTPKNYKEHIDVKSAEYKLANISEVITLIDEAKKEGFIFTSIKNSSDKNHIYVNFKKGKTCFRQYLFNFAENSYEMIKD